MPIVVNRANGNLASGDLEPLDLTDDDNGIIFGGLALDTGGIATFNTATIGTDQFVTDSSHDEETAFGTQTFIIASGVIAPPIVSGNQTFTQNTTGTFNGTGFHMLDVSGINQTTPLKEISPPSIYNNAPSPDITYSVDSGGLAILMVTTNIGTAPATIPGWTTFGTEKSISIISSVRLYYRIAIADEVDSTVDPLQGASGRGYSRIWVYNPESAPPPDTTAPVLSAATSTNPTSVGFMPTVDTDEANGTLHMVVVPDGDSPTATQVKAGQQSNGSAATISESLVVSTTGTIEFSNITELDMGTDYELYFVHSDASANDSTMVTAAAATNTFGLTQLIEHYTIYSGVLTSPHAASNSSGAGFDEETNRVGMIRNNSAELHEYDASDLTSIVRTVTLSGNFSDMEGITYMGSGEIAVCAENGGGYYVYIYDLPTGSTDITITPKQLLTISDAATDNNSSAEGISFDKVLKVFWVVGEGEQANTSRRIFRFERPVDQNTDYTSDDPELNIIEPFDPEVAFASYGATGAIFDLSGLSMDMTTGNLLILSDTGKMLLQVDVTDTANPIVVSELDITGLFQPEGVEVIDNGRLLIMGETNEYTIREASTTVVISLNQVSETNTPQALTFDSSYEIPLNQSVESTLAQLITVYNQLSESINQVQHTESAFALSLDSPLTQAIEFIAELDQSLDLTPGTQSSIIINQATETELSNQVLAELNHIQNLLQATEIDTAQLISELLVSGGQISQATEVHSVFSMGLSSEITLVLGQNIETHTPQNIQDVLVGGDLISLAQEVDSSFAFNTFSALSVEIGLSTESNLTLPMADQQEFVIEFNNAQENDIPNVIIADLDNMVSLPTVSESDNSRSISELLIGATPINLAEETDTPGTLSSETTVGANISTAFENMFSQSFTQQAITNIPIGVVNSTEATTNLAVQTTIPATEISLVTEINIPQTIPGLVDSLIPVTIAQSTEIANNILVSLGLNVALDQALETELAQEFQIDSGGYQVQFSQAFELDVSRNILDPFADSVSYAILGPITSYKRCIITSKKSTKVSSFKITKLTSEIGS
jgi:uncharacterized protein YjiK